MSDRFWNKVRVAEWRRDLIEPCSECGMATQHRVGCSNASFTEDEEERASVRRRMIDRAVRRWKSCP